MWSFEDLLDDFITFLEVIVVIVVGVWFVILGFMFVEIATDTNSSSPKTEICSCVDTTEQNDFAIGVSY